jgi:triosephosphate isomerase
MNALRTPLLAANWKQNQRWEDCEAYVAQLRELLPAYFDSSAPLGVELLICPAHPYIPIAGDLLSEAAVFLGAQDVSRYGDGAYTGAVGAGMLADLGCDFCIVGHSERRHVFGDDDAAVGDKLARLREAEIVPILCVGEKLEVRDSGQALPFTLGQLTAVRDELQRLEPGGLVIAYEPVWAIGTGRNAEPVDAEEMAGAIRGWLKANVGLAQAEACLILYGGSVKPENIAAYAELPDIDGALVGGASLKASSLAALAAAIRELL